MELRIFTLPFDEVSEGFPDEIVTHFCQNKKVHNIRTEFFKRDGRPFWSVAVQYEVVLKGEDKVRLLDDAQMLLYDRLRQWRKEFSMRKGIPPYLVASNEHLLQMIQLKCGTLEMLKQIKGFGRKRIAQYGKPIVSIIKDYFEKNPAKQAETLKADAADQFGEMPF